ncbi:hypothetical protein A2160_02110 [Candidatus Beckwithbacteria bacterium RBG_13_42_9]|uniref:EfeO-type cupredoxin-like domain-containing protein n=1 Tax=Candidatus Beckwithbacteria bacterium RBG_13_42_9 TaxID=1797457 RepID=A0A1F5E7U8_9BACT|nr:MAG: hypothetical protein A2160_02110 [Candidatus Beckwithbacteria bacterium RBG_13_42_9]
MPNYSATSSSPLPQTASVPPESPSPESSQYASPSATASPSADMNPSAQSTNITISNFSFNPATLTIPAGTEVTFTNNDSVTHTVTGTNLDSGDIAPGDSYKHVFTDPGTYGYNCSIHPNMKGTIIIQ